jgi:hypothetical protein
MSQAPQDDGSVSGRQRGNPTVRNNEPQMMTTRLGAVKEYRFPRFRHRTTTQTSKTIVIADRRPLSRDFGHFLRSSDGVSLTAESGKDL